MDYTTFSQDALEIELQAIANALVKELYTSHVLGSVANISAIEVKLYAVKDEMAKRENKRQAEAHETARVAATPVVEATPAKVWQKVVTEAKPVVKTKGKVVWYYTVTRNGQIKLRTDSLDQAKAYQASVRASGGHSRIVEDFRVDKVEV
jgi:hypothetical protein